MNRAAQWTLTLTLVAVTAPCTPQTQAAVVDQATPFPSSQTATVAFGTRDVAQTITFGRTGLLTRIDLAINRIDSSVVDPILIDVRTLSGAAPTDSDTDPNILGSVSVPATALPVDQTLIPAGETSIDFSAANVHVTAGMQLALVLRTDAPNVTRPGIILPPFWVFGQAVGAPNYLGGAMYLRNNPPPQWTLFSGSTAAISNDLAFRVYVTPEPAALVLVALAALSIATLRMSRLFRP